MCENKLDDFSKLHALFTGLRPDIKRKCLLDKDDEQWSSYAGLRAHLFKVGVMPCLGVRDALPKASHMQGTPCWLL